MQILSAQSYAAEERPVRHCRMLALSWYYLSNSGTKLHLKERLEIVQQCHLSIKKRFLDSHSLNIRGKSEAITTDQSVTHSSQKFHRIVSDYAMCTSAFSATTCSIAPQARVEWGLIFVENLRPPLRADLLRSPCRPPFYFLMGDLYQIFQIFLCDFWTLIIGSSFQVQPRQCRIGSRKTCYWLII